ncbi:hypothetical protein AWZ03_002694 [Drosophila navojoa]|uniref:Uncharacterized protein n=1 Tax=Drosophila navojoa TaxID=7232 RepID=A0A484BQE8_DRONA|nr:trichohyalin-like [Drosophila navojoa]TDG51039.1 hypothetical protein AWZ03_002694 [Drosophila navojoa]
MPIPTMDKACLAPPGHVRFLDNRREVPGKRKIFPVVVTAKRFEAIMGRSRMDKKHAAAAQKEEDERYMKYLQEGSDWLCKHFTNVGAQSLDEEKQAKLDQELREGEIRAKQVKMEDDLNRKKRIIRANRILEDLKAGQRALHHAVVESQVVHERQYNEAVNREIAEDARREIARQDAICPETLIPFSTITEEEVKAEEAARAIRVREEFLKDLAERRERKLAQEEQELCDTLIERAQYQCLYEKEKKEQAERKAKKREFCRRAYRDALKEKARIREYERIREQINDRVICVDVTRRRNLDKRYNVEYKKAIAAKIKERAKVAQELGEMMRENECREKAYQTELVDRYQAEVEMDEGRRQCEKDELARQRRAYEREDRLQAEARRQREAQIHRFEVAERFKNMETNRRFYASEKRKRDQATANLRKVLFGQRDEFLARRMAEKMRVSSCQADPYIKDDVIFFDDAAKAVVEAYEEGKIMYPMAKAAEIYRRQNQIGHVPEGRMVGRSKLRDYCWPGYHSKADLAYKNYEAREQCRQELDTERQKILDNCITITKLASKERPYQKCEMECPQKCFQYRGMPAIQSMDSFDSPSNFMCEEEPVTQGGPCPANIEVMTSCDEKEAQTRPKNFNNPPPVCVARVPSVQSADQKTLSRLASEYKPPPEPDCKDAKQKAPLRKRVWR